MNNDDLCTVLVSSCDAYEEIWELFLKALKAEWPDRPWPLVLSTETKYYNDKDLNVKTFGFYKQGENPPWGELLLKHLNAIKTKYVCFMIDDYILESKVDQSRLDQVIDWLEKDNKIAVFSFFCVKDKKTFATTNICILKNVHKMESIDLTVNARFGGVNGL
jgi:hypothetical protein